MEQQSKSSSDILVTGGTGLLGKAVCALLSKRGIGYAVATHKKPVDGNMVHMDLTIAEGMDTAILNRKVILHLASDKKHPDNDVSGTKKLLQEIVKLNYNAHFIYISIVGIDELPMPYFRQKLQVEQEIKKSGVTYSIIRATQFHNYIDQILKQFLKFPLGILPHKVPVQPIDVSVVAEQLVNMCFEQPSNHTENIGGKEVLSLEEIAAVWLNIQNKRKTIVNMPLWGKAGRSLKAGSLTCANKTSEGKDWKQWVMEEYQ